MTDTTPTPGELEIQPGSPEHDAAMIAKVDEANGTQPDQETAAEARPEWLPEQFETPEDMARAYAEMEQKLAQGGEPPADAAGAAKEATESAGLDFEELSTRYMETGTLSDEDFAALSKVGISAEMVQAYAAGQQAIADQIITDVFGMVGGQEAFTQMTEWAGTSLPAADVDAFNRAMDTGDLATIKLAVSGLRSRFTAEVGQEPALVRADSSAGGVSTFQSVAQLTAAMRDPRYKSDAAYRQDVAARLAKSSIM